MRCGVPACPGGVKEFQASLRPLRRAELAGLRVQAQQDGMTWKVGFIDHECSLRDQALRVLAADL